MQGFWGIWWELLAGFFAGGDRLAGAIGGQTSEVERKTSEVGKSGRGVAWRGAGGYDGERDQGGGTECR